MILFNQTAVWCNVFRPERLSKIAGWNGGNIAGAFYPRGTTRDQADAVRRTVRPDGTKLKFALYEFDHFRDASGKKVYYTPADLAQVTHGDITRLAAGCTEWDIERFDLTDDGQMTYIADAVAEFRALRPTHLLRINIAPFKGGTLPIDVIVNDPALYVTEQCYYGEMDPVREADAIFDIPEAIRNTGRWGLCLGAATEPRGPDGKYLPSSAGGKRQRNLGTIMSTGQYVRKLGSCDIYTDDLMSDVGYIV